MKPNPVAREAGLSRAHRLTRRSEFEQVMKSGVRTRDECFNVYAFAAATTSTLNLATLNPARLGVTVAKRVSARAVARNRIKRQIRESFRLHRLLLQGVSVVVAAQPPAGKKSNAQLRASLDKHWEQVTQKCKISRRES